MKPSERIKPISYVKSHVSEIVGSLFLTQNPKGFGFEHSDM